MKQHRTPGRYVRVFLALVLAAATITVASGPAEARLKKMVTVERQHVLGQGGEGVSKHSRAKLVRRQDGLQVRWKIKTPRSGDYLYPTADSVPPGAPPHPEVVPGSPEVFTLWMFIFNHPELCNGPCDMDDIVGDPPAQGGIYQLDGTVATGRTIRMEGRVRLGHPPAVGAALTEPFSAEVHIAMAPHGMALSGADLARQLNGAIGGPQHWWPSFFE